VNNNWDGFVGRPPAVTFSNKLGMIPFERFLVHANEASASMVDCALARKNGQRTLEDFAVLLSPAAGERLEEIAQASHELTIARFGRTMQMYAPLYVSNECLSTCTYCGFARTLPIVRRTLSVAETLREARHLRAVGFRSVLLLTGEHESGTGVEFLEQHIRALTLEVPQISLEVQVWSEAEYRRLVAAGADGVTIYQETYHPETYSRVHEAGRKRRYLWRLLGPERAARAGVRRIGIGALLGLHPEWRYDAIATAAHAAFLQRHAWRSAVSVSLPRMRPSESHFLPERPVTDRELTQYVCALRLFLPDAGLVASTREPASLRDGLFRVGITRTSAGSHTEPGGYEEPDGAGGQFETADKRSVAEVASCLRSLGYEPVWEDWVCPTEAVERMLAEAR
jgi:2-iminoacetate synthase